MHVSSGPNTKITGAEVSTFKLLNLFSPNMYPTYQVPDGRATLPCSCRPLKTLEHHNEFSGSTRHKDDQSIENMQMPPNKQDQGPEHIASKNSRENHNKSTRTPEELPNAVTRLGAILRSTKRKIINHSMPKMIQEVDINNQSSEHQLNSHRPRHA